MTTKDVVSEIKTLLKNELDIVIALGIYTGKSRNFAVYVFEDSDDDHAENEAYLHSVNIQLTFYVEKDIFETKESAISLFKANDFFVEDNGYTSIDEATKLFTFALNLRKTLN